MYVVYKYLRGGASFLEGEGANCGFLTPVFSSFVPPKATYHWKWAVAIANAKEKKSAGALRTTSVKKAKGPSAKEKQREFSLFPPFAAPHWKLYSRAPILSRGKARVVSKVYAAFPCCMFVLHVRSEFLSFMLSVHAA
jgi:hypothetical protein